MGTRNRVKLRMGHNQPPRNQVVNIPTVGRVGSDTRGAPLTQSHVIRSVHIQHLLCSGFVGRLQGIRLLNSMFSRCYILHPEFHPSLPSQHGEDRGQQREPSEPVWDVANRWCSPSRCVVPVPIQQAEGSHDWDWPILGA